MPLQILENVKVGQRPKASDQNTVVSVVNALQNISTSGDIEAALDEGTLSIIVPKSGKFSLPVVETYGVNGTSAGLDRFEVAAIEQDEFQDVGTTGVDRIPAVSLRDLADGDVGNWVVALEQIDQDSSGRVAVGGFCFALVARTVANEARVLNFAEMNSGESHLITSPVGTARILWEDPVEDYDDPHLALIQIAGGSPALFGEATSAPAGGTLTVKLATSDGTLVGDNITLYDGGL